MVIAGVETCTHGERERDLKGERESENGRGRNPTLCIHIAHRRIPRWSLPSMQHKIHVSLFCVAWRRRDTFTQWNSRTYTFYLLLSRMESSPNKYTEWRELQPLRYAYIMTFPFIRYSVWCLCVILLLVWGEWPFGWIKFRCQTCRRKLQILLISVNFFFLVRYILQKLILPIANGFVFVVVEVSHLM